MKPCRFVLLLVLILSCNFLIKYNVSAVGYDVSYFPDCTNDGTCIAMCGYTNYVPSNSKQIETVKRSSYIYYDRDENTFFVHFRALADEKGSTLKANHKNVIFSNVKSIGSGGRGSYNSLISMLSSGECPKYSYIDTRGLAYEVCFDNNGTSCIENENNMGTKFQGTSELAYNYQQHIEIYFTDKVLGLYSCDQFNSNKNILDIITGEVEKSFINNFLHGKNIPSFIVNSGAYKKKIEQLQETIKQYAKKCKDEIASDTTKSEEEKKDILEGLSFSDNDLKNTMEKVDETMKSHETKKKADDVPANCDALLTEDVQKLLHNILNIVKYAGPILVIVLTIMDLIKSSLSGDEGEIKKVSSKFVKRLIAAILLFFIPILIGFLFDFFDITSSSCLFI